MATTRPPEEITDDSIRKVFKDIQTATGYAIQQGIRLPSDRYQQGQKPPAERFATNLDLHVDDYIRRNPAANDQLMQDLKGHLGNFAQTAREQAKALFDGDERQFKAHTTRLEQIRAQVKQSLEAVEQKYPDFQTQLAGYKFDAKEIAKQQFNDLKVFAEAEHRRQFEAFLVGRIGGRSVLKKRSDQYTRMEDATRTAAQIEEDKKAEGDAALTLSNAERDKPFKEGTYKVAGLDDFRIKVTKDKDGNFIAKPVPPPDPYKESSFKQRFGHSIDLLKLDVKSGGAIKVNNVNPEGIPPRVIANWAKWWLDLAKEKNLPIDGKAILDVLQGLATAPAGGALYKYTMQEYEALKQEYELHNKQVQDSIGNELYSAAQLGKQYQDYKADIEAKPGIIVHDAKADFDRLLGQEFQVNTVSGQPHAISEVMSLHITDIDSGLQHPQRQDYRNNPARLSRDLMHLDQYIQMAKDPRIQEIRMRNDIRKAQPGLDPLARQEVNRLDRELREIDLRKAEETRHRLQQTLQTAQQNTSRFRR